jgi:GTP cyclohydrolase IA
VTSTATISTDRAVDRAAVRRWRPRVAHTRPEIDPGAAERPAADLLTALGLDLADENLAETPRRMAHALIEMTSGSDFELTTFPNDEGYDELVLAGHPPAVGLRAPHAAVHRRGSHRLSPR